MYKDEETWQALTPWFRTRCKRVASGTEVDFQRSYNPSFRLRGYIDLVTPAVVEI